MAEVAANLARLEADEAAGAAAVEEAPTAAPAGPDATWANVAGDGGDAAPPATEAPAKTRAGSKRGARKAATGNPDRLAGGKQDHEVPSEKEVANDANLMAAAKGRKAKAPRTPKPGKANKPRRVSALDAAAQVLAASDGPLGAKDMIAQMQAQRLWSSPGGKTPEATLYAAIIREIAAKGTKARFKKHDRGLFVATGHAGKEG